MAIISMRSQKRVLEIGLSGLVCTSAILLQLLVLNYQSIHGVVCNLPLTLLIVWGLVFGTNLPSLTAMELRRRSMSEIFTRQLSSGSISGLLVGLFFACIYFSLIPVFPICYPIIGWVAGYFCLRGLSQGNLLCIPMVFILTLIAEGMTAWQLMAIGRPGIFDHLSLFILPEALLNSIIAPFIYFPMRRWYDMVEGQQSYFPID